MINVKWKMAEVNGMKRTFLNRLLLTAMTLLALACSSDDAGQANAQTPVPSTAMGRTLVVSYSYTGNCRTVAHSLQGVLQCDVQEVEPAEKGLRYEANGYELGTQLLNAIKAAPEDAASYPAIDPVDAPLEDYDNIVIVTPLWWSQMAAPMQTFLFTHRQQLAGKSIALIVSSASSGISGVVADARRLLPEATWTGDALWINNSNRSRTATLLTEWLAKQSFKSSEQMSTIYITIDGQTQRATLADTDAARALADKLQQGAVSVTLNSSGDFEIWGALGFSLPTSNQQLTAQPGDIILYAGSNICLFYGSNAWSYTRLGHIEGLTQQQLRQFLKAGESDIAVTLSLSADATSLNAPVASPWRRSNDCFSLDGRKAGTHTGVFVKGGRKFVTGAGR